MKKNTIASLQAGAKSKVKQIGRMAAEQRMTVGLDLGDRTSRYCILDEAGEKASGPAHHRNFRRIRFDYIHKSTCMRVRNQLKGKRAPRAAVRL